MKYSSLKIFQSITALAAAITLVFMTPTFVYAEGENHDSEDLNASAEVQNPRHIITNAALGEAQPSRVDAPRVQSNVTVLELPKSEFENKPLERTNNPGDNLAAQPANQILPSQTLVVIERGTSPKSVLAMRLLEKGRSLLRIGDRDKALSTFEKSLGLEANPCVYFYLSQTHYQLGHYKEALNFLEVAESWLDQQPDWALQITALKAEIPGSGFERQQIIAG